MPDVGFIAQHWNDALTLLTSTAVLVIGYYQVQHYRSQSPNLSILEVSRAVHRPEGGRGSYADDGGHEGATEYIFEGRIGNDGREPTTISDGSLTLTHSGEELDLMWYTGSTEVPITGQGEFNPPKRMDGSLRIDAQGIQEVEYRAVGEPIDDRSREIEGTIRLEGIDGTVAEESMTFVDRKE